VSFAPVLLIVAAQAAGASATGLPMNGGTALEFLREAEVVSVEYFDNTAATKPRKVTLSMNGSVHFAVFKTIDTHREGFERASTRALHQVHDSYRHEIAAWELADLMGLDVVPPCIERELDRETGSLCLWVEGASTARQLQKQDRFHPPDQQRIQDQLDDIRLFLQLVWDAEYNQASNILVDGSWKLYKIDSSRSFKPEAKPKKSGSLSRYRQRTVAALEAMTREQLDERLGPWLEEDEIDALWKRRNRVLRQVEESVQEHGESATLY
jgi:hypothetical protein